MFKSPMGFIKGMLLGVAVGAAGVTAVKMAMCNSHSMSKGGAKVVRAMGDLVDGVQTMFR